MNPGIANTKSELSGRIIETAMDAFLTEGIKPVRMDDIANRLSISKRTLYETFRDKEELLSECLKRHRQNTREHMTSIYEKSDNIMDVILAFYVQHLEELKRVNYRFFEDLKKYPAVLAQMKEEHDRSQQATVQFFRKGVEQGLFREDIDMELVTRLMNTLCDGTMKKDLGRTYPLDALYKTIILIFIRGIATEKGEQTFDRIMTEYENKIKQNRK